MLLSISVLFACAPAATPLPVPTQTLIPSTATATTIPTKPTNTPPNLSNASDLLATAAPPALPTPLLENDGPLDDRLLRHMINDLAVFLGTSPTRIGVVSVEPRVWISAHLGCDDREIFTRPIAGYRYLLFSGTTTYAYHTEDQTRFMRCPGSQPLRDEALLAADAIAAEMAMIARNSVAEQRDLPLVRVSVRDAEAHTWPDTSLGCPLPDTDYSQAQIPGYRFVITTATETFIFHTDSARLYACDAAREVLPD